MSDSEREHDRIGLVNDQPVRSNEHTTTNLETLMHLFKVILSKFYRNIKILSCILNVYFLSKFSTINGKIKGNVGTGLLSLPLAIYHGGWILGPIMLVFISIMAVHCMHLLVSSANHLCKEYNIATMDYGDVAEHALKSYGPLWLKRRPSLGLFL